MKFEENPRAVEAGFALGYVLAYGVFTTVLYFILNWRHDIFWTKVLAVTLGLMIIGELLRRALR